MTEQTLSAPRAALEQSRDSGHPDFVAIVRALDAKEDITPALMDAALTREPSREGFLLLMSAVNHDHVQGVAALWPRAQKMRDLIGDTPLIQAAWRGFPKVVEAILSLCSEDEGPLAANADGHTPLLAAIQEGRVDCVQMLIPLSDPDALERFGRNAVGLAASAGQPEALAALLASERFRLQLREAPLKGNTSRHGDLPLALAITHATRTPPGYLAPHMECVRLLASACDPLAPDAEGHTPLMNACHGKRDGALVAAILPFCDPDRLRNGEAARTIEWAVSGGDWASVDLLADFAPPLLVERVFAIAGGARGMPRWAARLEASDLAKAAGSDGRAQAMADGDGLASAPTRRAPKAL